MSKRLLSTRQLALATTSAVALLSAVPAMAQQAPAATDVQEIVVTGFRASLANALAVERDSNLIVQSVTAEDMGKMPDQDIAESLQRLSGVQIDRDNGEGTKVRIRGLDQNVTLLNGEYFVTGLEAYQNGEASGSGQGNTATNSLESIPADLIAGVDVVKSPQANMVEGGLGGIVNLKTRAPLDTKLGWNVGGHFEMSESDNNDKGWGPQGAIVGTFNYKHIFAVAASFSYADTNTHTNAYEAQNRSPWALVPAGTTGNFGNNGLNILNGGIGQTYIVPELAYVTSRDVERKRISGSVDMEWAVNDSIILDLDWVHSSYDYLIEEVSGKMGLAYNTGSGIVPTVPYSIDANGVVSSAQWGDSQVESDTDVQNARASADNVHFGAKWDNGGDIRASMKVSYATSTLTSDEAQQDEEHTCYPSPPGCENSAAPGGEAPTTAAGFIYFAYTNNGTVPSMQFLGPYANIWSNPAYEISKSAWAWQINSNQYDFAARGDVEYDAKWIKAVDTTFTAGFRYADKNLDYVKYQFLLNKASTGLVQSNPSGSNSGQGYDGQVGTYGYYMDPGITNYITGNPAQVIFVKTALANPGNTKLIDNSFLVNHLGGPVLAQDPDQMKNPEAWLQGNFPNFPGKNFKDALDSFDVDQKTYAGYMMGDMGSRADRFHLNYGVRVVENVQTVGTSGSPDLAHTSWWGDAPWEGSVLVNWLALSQQTTYTDVLPDFNAVYDVTDSSKVRFSGARVMSPPNPFQLGEGLTANYTEQTTASGGRGYKFVGGSGGNPNLQPFRATQFDASYEDYFGKQGAVSAGLFYKQVDTFITNGTTTTCLADDFGVDCAPVNVPVNGQGGSIKGVELGGQYAFDNGFGFNVNYTYSLSRTDSTDSFSSHLPIPGVSLHSATGQFYYQYEGFEGRISYSWRSGNLNGDALGSTFTGVQNIVTGVYPVYGVYNKPYGQLDGQLSYDVNKNFGVVAEFVNITNSAVQTYLQYKNQPFEYTDVGRRFNLGFRFKL